MSTNCILVKKYYISSFDESKGMNVSFPIKYYGVQTYISIPIKKIDSVEIIVGEWYNSDFIMGCVAKYYNYPISVNDDYIEVEIDCLRYILDEYNKVNNGNKTDKFIEDLIKELELNDELCYYYFKLL